MSNHARTRGKRRWKARPMVLITALLALAGMVMLLYTPTASWFSQYNQSKLIKAYDEQAIPPAGQRPSPALKVAEEYNQRLAAGAVLEANTNVPTSSSTVEGFSTPYDDILSFGSSGIMARIRIPSIDVDLPVYHGTSDETLLKGSGHLEGTSLPVGGVDTHSVITAHRGLANATMFTNLNRVKVGDEFYIEVAGEVLTYRVTTTEVVAPEDTESLRTSPGKDLVTLVTCTPLGINSHRILVTGERVPTPADVAMAPGQVPAVPRFPYWGLILVGGLGVIGAYVWWAGLVRDDAVPAGRRGGRTRVGYTRGPAPRRAAPHEG